MEKIWTKITRTVRYGYLRIVRINAPAESIALGLALGVFSGAFPFLSLQMAMAVSLAFLLGGNLIAAALGTWWTNPFNWAIVFPLLYMVGRFFVPSDAPALSIAELSQLGIVELLERGWQWLLITSLGSMIVGIPMAILTYAMTLRMVRMYQASRARRRGRRIPPSGPQV
ncbi:hypothetical protein MASR1M90_10410 [Desulfovibrionales bacterium]